MKKLLSLRKEKKLRKPAFMHQDSWKRKLLPKKWRKPKGLHSKMRMKFKGNPKLPSQGYRSPRQVRGVHGNGLNTVLVNSLKELEKVTSEAIIIGSGLGAKKRVEMIVKAAEKKIKIVNFNPEEYLKKIRERLEGRKKKKAEVLKKEIGESKEHPKEDSGKDGDKSKEHPKEDSGKDKKKTDQKDQKKEDSKQMEKVITKRS